MPTAYSTAPAPETAAPRARWRGVRRTLAVLIVAVLAGVAAAFIWAAGRYQQGVELAKKAREQYAALDAKYPFQPSQAPTGVRPVPAADPAKARWAALLRVRDQVHRQASPRLRQIVQTLLDAPSLTSPELYREALAGVPLLKPLLDEQLAALAREQMGAREYQWRLGLAAVSAMEDPERYPAGRQYWAVLGATERLSRTDGDPRDDVVARAAFEQLRKAYRGAAPPPEDVLRGLEGGDQAACAIDLLMAAAQWATAEGMNPETLLQRARRR